MTARSVPEALLHYYICKYVDASATLNEIKIDKYLADITFINNGIKYDLEYDSLSGHCKRVDKDLFRDNVFKKYGYTVIRFRNYTKAKSMPDVPDCINIGFPLNYISKTGTFPRWQIIESEKGLCKLMQYLNIVADINIEHDYNNVLDMYFPGITLKRINIKH